MTSYWEALLFAFLIPLGIALLMGLLVLGLRRLSRRKG
jgi:hypothetical protein